MRLFPKRRPWSRAMTITYRHSALTRIWHWINAVVMTILLASGLQIFNAHPELYWGKYGSNLDTPFLTIGTSADDPSRGVVTIGALVLPTTGVLGVSDMDGEETARAFPSWATLPSFQDLALGRRWHFLAAWLLVVNSLIFFIYSLASGHFWRDLLPSSSQLSARNLLREIAAHVRLRFPKGNEARNYNSLQKIAYLVALGLLLPLMVLSGFAMSPGLDSAFPWILDLFAGRQSARTIHFITATSLVAFSLVHVAMVVLSGPINNIRAMITGRYAIFEED